MWPMRQQAAGIRPFYLYRLVDQSGVSGTGIVAIGVVLPSGKAVLEWRSRWKTLTVFESVEQVLQIHGHGGRTQLQWGEPPLPEPIVGWGAMWRHVRPPTPHPGMRVLQALPAASAARGQEVPSLQAKSAAWLASARTRLLDWQGRRSQGAREPSGQA